MRARNLKPSLFRNELLAVSDPIYTVIFEGLWCIADREGRLEDRPAKIHLEINPGRAYEGTERALNWLAENQFIARYSVAGQKFIQVVNFLKHQKPHQNEVPSTIPSLELATKVESTCDLGTPHLALNPSSLNPSSLNPECSSSGRDPPKRRASAMPEDFGLTEDRKAYATGKLPNVNADELMQAFRDYHSGKGTVGKDWDAYWRTYVRNALKFGYPTLPLAPVVPMGKRPPTAEEITAAQRKAAEDNQRQLHKALGGVFR